MRPIEASWSTRLWVGLFSGFGFLGLAVFSVWVNQKPYWWKPCRLVQVHVADATGIKNRSIVRSLGVEIGYLRSVNFVRGQGGDGVALGICITAPVRVLPSTRAVIRGEGMLGDKFIELRPIEAEEGVMHPISSSGFFRKKKACWGDRGTWRNVFQTLWQMFLPEAHAEERSSTSSDSEGTPQWVPIESKDNQKDLQELLQRMDSVVQQVSGVVQKVHQSIDPEEIRSTLKQLNKTLEGAANTFSPKGNLNQTAQRSLGKLEAAIEQLQEILTRVNEGKGSLGKIINDETYAQELKKALQGVNQFLSRVSRVRFHVDIGGIVIPSRNLGRGWGQLGLWPSADRYYLVGVVVDGRGTVSQTKTTTTVGGVSQTTFEEKVTTSSLLVTAMVGKLFLNNRLDLSVGALYGDGAASIAWRWGPAFFEDRFQWRGDAYFSRLQNRPDLRLTGLFQPIPCVCVRLGLESMRSGGFFYGAGVTFDDDDIKLLFSLK